MLPAVNDIVQHTGFTNRSRLVRIAQVLRVQPDHIALWFDMEERERRVSTTDFLRWWVVIQPAGAPTNEQWQRGAVYLPRKTMCEAFGIPVSSRAVVVDAGPNWISFFNKMEGLPSVFRIVECKTFEEHWLPNQLKTSWERLLDDFL